VFANANPDVIDQKINLAELPDDPIKKMMNGIEA
jgi:hypothetical protein